MKQQHSVLFYLILSGVGILLLSAVVLQAPVATAKLSFFEKIFLGSIFLCLCLLGVSLCLRPNWIKTLALKKDNARTNQGNEVTRCFIGHHPDCSVFDYHRIVFNKKTWCAGCIGLLFGCLLSSGLMILYVLGFPPVALMGYRLLFFVGMFCIIFVYAELLTGSRSRIVHIIANSTLVLSFLFITVSIGELTGNVIDGFFTILLCVLWLDTRILLSKWRHSLLCSNCSKACKTYS